ncbi:MAG: quinol:cytochrome C oxidoreductase [Bacteroidetes bacterium]|nr:quinol:cytochrome C oxidoreductase [Bacteroidota bacterium]
MESLNQKFTFTSKTRNLFIGISVVGLVLILAGLVVHKDQYARFWANFLLSNFYFFAFSIVAVSFLAIQYLAHAGWSAGIKRIPEAMSTYLPIPFIGFLIIIGASFMHGHGMTALYEWTHESIVKADPVLTGKSPYLNSTFWIIRVFVYFAIWILCARAYRAYSRKEDEVGGMEYYHKQVKLSAGFLPAFGVTFCLAAFDWFMSIQPHWYSTIFAVNVWASAFVGFMTVTNITIILLKKNNYMQWVSENHMHDLGKFMFAFSVFWTYTWLSQFLLIWYANLPEETPYYLARMWGNWKYLFFLNLFLNFACPFLMFMMRDAKRTPNWILFVGAVLLMAKYLDWYIIVMPFTAGHTSGFGLYEIGFYMFFGGMFCYSLAYSLSKANLVPTKHPYLIESLHHEV